ncbi:unnamed protein product [Mucor hiemalis]
MDATVKVEQPSSDYDIYAALMLSSLLDSEQDVKDQQEQSAKLHNEKLELEPEESDVDVIWVPADKHPEIAPTEFANFIKTHGANTPTRRTSSLHRRKSILSQSLSARGTTTNDDDVEDELDLNRTLSEKKRRFLQKVMSDSEKLKAINTHTFDRNSTSLDDSRIIAPKADKSLLRRSAFSARGRSRKSASEGRQQRRTVSQRKPSTTTLLENDTQEENAKTKSWDKSEGISLYDQPVNMSEWIDLGSASLESDDSQRGILSRVHDAESQLRTQQIMNEDESTTPQPPPSPPPPVQIVEVKVKPEKPQPEKEVKMVEEPVVSSNKVKRPGMIRSPTESNSIPTSTVVTKRPKPEKRSSWLGGLFQSSANVYGDKKNIATAAVNNSSNGSPLSGLATLFSRSLSMKSNISSTSNHNTNLSMTTKKAAAAAAAAKAPNTTLGTHITPTTTTTTTTNINNTNNTISTNNSTSATTTILQSNNKKKRSSRLEIPPPSERTFYNTSRLPLHVERAIYRLSHMKLADPRRPLRQQVLISNLMFWYLSIQQSDYQKQEEQRVEQQNSLPPLPDPQQQQNKKVGKMSRLIHSAKKRKSEVVQFVQTYPLTGNAPNGHNNQESIKKSNVQFSLAPIPSHHYPILNFDKEEEEDDLPLSHYRS